MLRWQNRSWSLRLDPSRQHPRGEWVIEIASAKAADVQLEVQCHGRFEVRRLPRVGSLPVVQGRQVQALRLHLRKVHALQGLGEGSQVTPAARPVGRPDGEVTAEPRDDSE